MTARVQEKYCLPIAGIGRTGERQVEVLLHDGRGLWRPRSQCEFYPGKVFFPLWLAKRLAEYVPAACSTVKAPATATVPPAVDYLHTGAHNRRDAQR